MIKNLTLFVGVLIVVNACSPTTDASIVNNLEEFDKAIVAATPGTIIKLADGVWSNVELVAKGKGSKEQPILVQAQTPGKVIITGQSNLSISGEFIEVSGLLFRDGYTPTSEVISFRTSKEELANNCRVTNCVIDNYNNPERFDADYWVSLYGKNNQFDHNSLVGKGNRGVTMAVRMNTEQSQENSHIIEYNYFGPRKALGSNGGETLRIGTSHYSRSYSNTVVQNNYFDQTGGELEIISSKSCGNIIKNNVFYECKGTLTMRHGHHTLVEGNYFLGNRKPNTGGIRIINEYQTVQNNYLYGLTGYRFRSALTIMNGVPNSPINRYNQVIDSHMKRNIVIESDHIQLCAGSDQERSATPTGSSFEQNIILTSTNPEPFTIYDDVSGIQFAGNVISESAKAPFSEGFETVEMQTTVNDHGLSVPSADLVDAIDFGEIKLPISKSEVGASYFDKEGAIEFFDTGKEINVAEGTNTLLDALNESKAGDILVLANAKTYLLTKYAIVEHPITIRTNGGEKAVIVSEKQSFFKIENGGALQFENILFDGAESPDQAGNNVISTSKYAMNQNYAVVINNCEVKDLDKNHSFDFLKSYKHTFADSVVIANSTFTNVTGAIMTMDMEVEDLGIYNVENVKISNSSFTDVRGAVANIYRGGTDESTFGPIVNISNVAVENSGKGKRNKVDGVFRFHGVQKLHVSDLKVKESRGIDLFLTNGEPISDFSNIEFFDSEGLKANRKEYTAKNIINKSK